MSVHESVASNNVLGGVGGAAVANETTRITVDDTGMVDNGGSGTSTSASGSNALASLDVLRSTMARNNTGYGASVSAASPGVAVMTVVSSIVSENAFGGIAGSGTGMATTFASGNTIARNATAGLVQMPFAAVHTRNNNAGEQLPPTSGTVTAVPGF